MSDFEKSMKKNKIAIASDHAGFELKKYLKEAFPQIDWTDEGPDNAERTDYPDYAIKVAKKVGQATVSSGVLVCGSGVGMCITANKIQGVRAVNAESTTTAQLSRQHNDTNILCLGARLLTPEYAKEILKTWLNTAFEGGRHVERLHKIKMLEKKNT